MCENFNVNINDDDDKRIESISVDFLETIFGFQYYLIKILIK